MIEATLEKLGLKDEEIKTFLFLLENGERTVGDLAKKTGIPRPSFYGFLKKLQDVGLVAQSQKNGVKTFLANPKDRVEKILDDKIRELETGKKAFEMLYSEIQKSGYETIPKFQYFEGKEGMRHALKDMLLYKNINTCAYWPIKSMIEILGAEFFRVHNKDRIVQKIRTRAIWPKKEKVNQSEYPFMGTGEKFLREIRIAPETIHFSMGYWIYGTKAAFISSKKEAFGFIIESKEFVEMLRSQFEVMWEISK